MLLNTKTVAGHIRDVALDRGDARSKALIAKTAVPGGTLSNPDYSAIGELEGAREFRTAIERRILPARLDAAWRIPFRTRAAIQVSGASGYWIEQGSGKPVSAFAAEGVRLEPATVASIVVLSNELLEASGGSSDAAIVRIVTNAISARVNSTFLGAAAAGSGAPAGLGATAVSTPSTGETAAALQADLHDVVALADAAGVDLTQASWVLSPARAALIAAAFGLDNLGMRGGMLLGAPALTDPAAGVDIYLVDGSRVAVAIGGIDVQHASSASLEMLDNPTNNSATGTATTVTSLFQTDSSALRATLAVNWTAADDAVFMIDATPPSP